MQYFLSIMTGFHGIFCAYLFWITGRFFFYKKERQKLTCFTCTFLIMIYLNEAAFFGDYAVYVTAQFKKCLFVDRTLQGLIDFITFNMGMLIAHKYYGSALTIYRFSNEARLPTVNDESSSRNWLTCLIISSSFLGISFFSSAWYLTSQKYWDAVTI